MENCINDNVVKTQIGDIVVMIVVCVKKIERVLIVENFSVLSIGECDV